MNAFTPLAVLAASWAEAKAAEQAATARRIEIEQHIVGMLPSQSTEGSVRQDVGDWRIGVTYKLTRTVDTDKLQAMWDDLGDKARAAFRWKAEVRIKEMRGLQEYVPAEYALIAEAIETKPAKPSVSVELVDKAAA